MRFLFVHNTKIGFSFFIPIHFATFFCTFYNFGLPSKISRSDFLLRGFVHFISVTYWSNDIKDLETFLWAIQNFNWVQKSKFRFFIVEYQKNQCKNLIKTLHDFFSDLQIMSPFYFSDFPPRFGIEKILQVNCNLE